MATTAVTSTTNTITALGAGSGVDVKALAQSLVDAEKAPRKNQIDNKIKKSEAAISGYSALKFVLNDLKTAFTNIKDQSAFNSVVPRVSQSNALSVTTTATASAGSHSVTVSNLAKPQRSISNTTGFETPTSQLNTGAAFNLVLLKGIVPTPSVQFTQGNADVGGAVGTKSTLTLTLKAMNVGDTLTINGLTLTANRALTKSEVGQMFQSFDTSAGAKNSSTINNTTLAVFGTFSGEFSSSYSSGLNNSGVLTLTSNANNAANIAAPLATQFSHTIAITENATTPTGVVAAINAANKGISAQLVNTGDATAPYKIMVTGATGASNTFSLSSLASGGGAVAGVNFATNLQQAEDAALNVNGIAITASSNRITDAIAGTTLELFTTTATDTNGQAVAARLDFTRDTSAVKTKIQALVTAYNDANTMLGVVSDPKSTVATYGATLVGNNIISQIRSTIRGLITTDSNTPSGGLAAFRDLGLTFDKTGKLQLDATKLDSALQNKFDNVVTLLTANQEKLSVTSASPAGVAGEAVKKLSSMVDVTAPITTQSNNQTTKITAYKKELEKLEARMSAMLTRYNKEFAAMDSIVGQSKSLQTGLKSTFEGMMSAYTNK